MEILPQRRIGNTPYIIPLYERGLGGLKRIGDRDSFP